MINVPNSIGYSTENQESKSLLIIKLKQGARGGGGGGGGED